MDETKNDPQVDDPKTSKKRKTRRGTRGKGRKINYKKDYDALKTNEDEDQNASRASTGRPREEGLRNQSRNEEDKRKSQPETLKPSERTPNRPPYQQWRTQRHEERREMHQWKGEQRTQQVFAVKDGAQKDNRKNWSHDHRQVSHHRRVQEQRDRGSVSQHGGKERDRGTRERSRVESTQQTERDGNGGRWRRGREWRLRRPYWQHDE